MRTAKKSGYLFAVLLLAVSACAGGEEAGAGDAAQPCQPCAAAQPCAADTMPAQPCNPCAANPCNPCATNPCNPCGGGH